MNAVFTGSPSNSPGRTPANASPTRQRAQPSVVRLQSRTLFYAENEHKAVFSGGVVAQTSTGVLHSSFMDVYFSPRRRSRRAGSRRPAKRQAPGSQVSKIVARGAVELQQPGRKGTGEELTYTAADGKFVLTGSSAAPPRLTDQVRGTVTGQRVDFQ